MKIAKSLYTGLALVLIAATGCSFLPSSTSTGNDTGTDNAISHARKMTTPAYTCNRAAIIFTLADVDNNFKAVTDQIVRTFAENGVPLDVALGHDSDTRYPALMDQLRDYEDAGIIDISLDGRNVNWLDADMPNLQTASLELTTQLSGARQRLGNYFGADLSVCVFPYEMLNKYNYGVLEASGFTTISTQHAQGFTFSRQPVDWDGMMDGNALCRIPIIGMVYYSGPDAEKNVDGINEAITNAANESILSLGIAAIGLEPYAFATGGDKPDAAKIQQLVNLITSMKKMGDIVTFVAWSKYESSHIRATPAKRVMPFYDGGSTVVFRLDDVSKGFHEDVDQAIIQVFRDNGVPLDCGVISNVNGTDSFIIPWLKQYIDDGTVGISVHGFDWTYYQLDTTKSGLAYEQIKFKLIRARDDYLRYYGVVPLALTVPTDFFDEEGYRAIDDAGFRVFATQMAIEPHPSNRTVDFNGRPTPDGMYRIPTAEDVNTWDAANLKWGEIVDISDLGSSREAGCQYYLTLTTKTDASNFAYSICRVLGNLGVAAVGLHPAGFVTQDGKIDQDKLKKLDAIVKWVKTFSTITTFEQWYNYTSTH